MKKTLLAVAALCALTSGAAMAQQQDGKWQIRARAVHINFHNGGAAHANADVLVKNKTIPEIDISYFFTPNIAAELILTYPQKLKVHALGERIGSLKALPPTLTLQYHFTNFGAFKPYVGAGINYTRFSSVKHNTLGEAVDWDVKKSSLGGALQVGFDVALDKNWSINFDVKKVWMNTKVDTALAGNLHTLRLNPTLVGVGVGYRF